MYKSDNTKVAYLPSDSEKDAINLVMDKFYWMLQVMSRTYPYFNDRNVIEYINDSVKRWNGYMPPRDDLTMDWQVQIFNNFTRNAVNSYLSKVAGQRPKMKFVATDEEGYQDVLRAHVIDKMYQYSKNRERGEEKFLRAALESTTKGTVVVYEGYRKTKRKIKEVVKFDQVTGKFIVKEKEIIDFDDCYQQIVPIEDFFIEDIWQPDIQLHNRVIWRSIYTVSQFEEEFSRYKNYSSVRPGMYASAALVNTTFFKEYSARTLKQDTIELLRFYDRLADRMIYMANGVILFDGCIPFTHKKLPFAKGIFEMFSSDFFYGRSLPDKIARDQDVMNMYTAMMLDQGLLSIYKPVLTDDPDDTEESVLVPGLIKKVNDINKYKVLEIPPPNAAHFSLLSLLNNNAQADSGQPFGGAQAQAQSGGAVTARQAMMQEELSRQMLSLNARYLEFMDRDAAELRAKNLLQFTLMPDKIEATTGKKTSEYKQLFSRIIRVDDTELTDGSYGTTAIRVYNKKNLPTANDLAVEEEMAASQGKNIEVIAISPDYIRNLDFDVQVVPESSYAASKSLEKALGTEFYMTALQNQLINQEENTREWVQLYNKDPDRFMVKQQQPMPGQLQPAVPGQPPQQLGATPTTPQVTSQVMGKNQKMSLDKLL